MDNSFVRCGHCRGFYELARGRCRYCGKDVPLKGPDGRPKMFADRATCRAIQIAEFEQLPPLAHKDPFQPDPEILDKKCHCLHCGKERGLFEAVEMRWLPNENMWACPCTTCGGRGFGFDVHLAERLWQCADCNHWYCPPHGDFRLSQAKCPKCGCTMANGWFDDEHEEDLAEEEMAQEEPTQDQPGAVPEGEEHNEPLWLDDEGEEWKKGRAAEAIPGMDYVTEHPAEENMPDDIDFPREFPHKNHGLDDDGPFNEDDIPF